MASDFAKRFSSKVDRNKPLGWITPSYRWLVKSDIQRSTDADVAKLFTPDPLMQVTGIPYASLAGAAFSLEKKFGAGLGESIVKQALKKIF